MVALAAGIVGALGAAAGGAAALRNSGGSVGNNNALIAAQNDIAFRNYYLQRELARQQQELATAGTRDARGNRTEYVPGVGWITTPTDETRGVISASDEEERLRLTRDAIRQRLQQGNQFNRQLQEGADADAVRYSGDVGAQSLNDVRAALIRRNAARSNSGRVAATQNIGQRSLLGANGADAIREMSRTASPDIQTAIEEARTDANPEYLARRTGREGDTLNRYNTLAGRATTPIGQQAAPSGIGTSLSQLLAARSQYAPATFGQIGGRLQAPTLGLQQQNQEPLGITNLSQALSGLIKQGGQAYDTLFPKTQTVNDPDFLNARMSQGF